MAQIYLARTWKADERYFENAESAEMFLVASGGGTIKTRRLNRKIRKIRWEVIKNVLLDNRNIVGGEFFTEVDRGAQFDE